MEGQCFKDGATSNDHSRRVPRSSSRDKSDEEPARWDGPAGGCLNLYQSFASLGRWGQARRDPFRGGREKRSSSGTLSSGLGGC